MIELDNVILTQRLDNARHDKLRSIAFVAGFYYITLAILNTVVLSPDVAPPWLSLRSYLPLSLLDGVACYASGRPKAATRTPSWQSNTHWPLSTMLKLSACYH